MVPKQTLKYCALAVMVLLFATSFVIVILALDNESNKKAGILALQVSVSDELI